MKIALRRRSGFTLLELIVVIGIILLLVGLTVGSVFRLRAAREETNTNTTLRKLDIGFQQKWKATLDDIRKEKIPQAVMEATRNGIGQYDPVRARAMHTMLRMKQEFPQNFGEVRATYPTDPYQGVAPHVYAGKPLILLAIQNSGRTAEEENAALLYMLLNKGTGGIEFNAEQAGPTKVLDFPQPNGPVIQLRVFIDEWGTPIAFRRTADDDSPELLDELNQAPFVDETRLRATPPKSVNPLDPEGRLALQGWPEQRKMFAYFASQNPSQRPFIANPFDGRNRGPFVFSAGRDKEWYPPFHHDNLYSHRLQQQGRGN